MYYKYISTAFLWNQQSSTMPYNNISAQTNWIRLTRYSGLLHATVIVIFLFTAVLLSPFSLIEVFSIKLYREMMLTKMIMNISLVAIFYLNLYKLTPLLLENKNIKRFLTFSALLLMCFVATETTLFYFVQKHNGGKFPFRPIMTNGKESRFDPFLAHAVGAVFSYLLVMLASSMLVLTKERVIQKEVQQNILYEKTAAELAALKLQIGPHFLFNTLNNIRWLARSKSERTEEAVVELAQLLRYIIQLDTEKVTLGKEIEYMNRYINLQKMRLQKHAKIEFNHSFTHNDVIIEPLLFISFIENAFKYGVHSHAPTHIKINIDMHENSLVFTCQNTISSTIVPKKEESSGLGIENVRKRLALNYPGKHKLEITNEYGFFNVSLLLDLAHG